MFFLVSKLLWLVLEPSNFIGFIMLAGILLLPRRVNLSLWLLGFGAMVYVACAFLPVSEWLTRPLEDRFARPIEPMMEPDGIIVLGGAVSSSAYSSRHLVQLGDHGSRMTEFITLARRFPNARLVFTGGSGELAGSVISESVAAKVFFESQGLATSRMIFEDQSRNTWENAQFTRNIVHPSPGQHWLLVTSAFHMPRSVGVFRRAGFDVVAGPADFATSGLVKELWMPKSAASTSLYHLDIAIREWIGLLAYYVSGKTDSLFPKP